MMMVSRRNRVFLAGIFTVFIVGATFAQDEVVTDPDKKARLPVEISYATYIEKHLVYPAQSRKNKVHGKVTVSFVVEKDGAIANATIVKGLNSECDSEALRLIQQMPRWQPALKDGKPVRTTVTKDVKFKIFRKGSKPVSTSTVRTNLRLMNHR